MTNLPSQARVVIIGGGAVGASSLYHLAKSGWTDCLLLEKNELTSGSTWHAAGNCPTFSMSWSLMNMQRYGAELYRGRAVGMGRSQGMALEVIGPDEITRRYPFIETHDLKGALYDPNDGDIDPAQLTQALAKGARIERFCPVTGVRRENGAWVVTTPKGEVRCEVVVNAAGYRAQEVGRMFGREVPMMVMSHQYILFEEIPELAAWTREVGRKLPLLRDVDTSYYLRQEKHGMNLGPYERNCRAHWAAASDPMPEDFSFQLFPDDLERLEWHLDDAMRRVPILATAGLSKVINDPIAYAPDGNPLIGPMPGAPDAFEACVFTFGIAQAGGAGKVLAEWVTEGRTEWDMWSCDPRRFTSFAAAPDYALAKGLEIYGNEYAIQLPRKVWPAGRNRKLSPLHGRLERLGAQFGPYNGWERVLWYAQPGDDTSPEATETFRREGPWHARVREECLAVRDAAGVFDLPGFSRFRVSGEGGRVVTEMSIMALEENLFFLITAAVAQWHDCDWLVRHLPEGSPIQVEDVTGRFTCQILSGPNAQDLGRGVRRQPPAALAHPPERQDRRPLVPARARVLRGRARLGDPHGGRGHRSRVRRRLAGRPAPRPETLRHVGARRAAPGEELSRLEAGSFDRLHSPPIRPGAPS